jgi:hypothetical protein
MSVSFIRRFNMYGSLRLTGKARGHKVFGTARSIIVDEKTKAKNAQADSMPNKSGTTPRTFVDEKQNHTLKACRTAYHQVHQRLDAVARDEHLGVGALGQEGLEEQKDPVPFRFVHGPLNLPSQNPVTYGRKFPFQLFSVIQIS